MFARAREVRSEGYICGFWFGLVWFGGMEEGGREGVVASGGFV